MATGEPQRTWDNLFFPPPDYNYFRRPAFDLSKADFLRAAWMADAAMLAYGRRGKRKMDQAEVKAIFAGASLEPEFIGDWFSAGASGTQGYFASNDRFGLLAFRGTEKDDPDDILTDLKALLIKNPKQDAWVPGSSEVLVHSGFHEGLERVWKGVSDPVASYRSSHPGAPLFITGHSLGAALATIALDRINEGPVCLYTYGCPRVGNPAFCARLKNREGYRMVDGNDLVTHVPPESPLYTHPSHRVTQVGSQPSNSPELGLALKTLAESALAFIRQAPPPDALSDHSPIRYCYYLWSGAGL